MEIKLQIHKWLVLCANTVLKYAVNNQEFSEMQNENVVFRKIFWKVFS